ncbi:MAG: HEAT repeat domain-containing protein [Desulfobacteraceae bacterium]|nr:HEAT repeat domain-containing protein [Desulfobacteraceae bacterium]
MQNPALEFLFAFNAAITNIRLYPSSSEIIQESVARMNKALQKALEESAPLEFAETDNRLLVQGLALTQKQHQKPQVSSFLAWMSDLGIKSLSFSEGTDRDEIFAFISILGKSAEQIEETGSLDRMISDAGIKNIAIGKKVYVTMGPDQRIVSGSGDRNQATEKENKAAPAREAKNEHPGFSKGEGREAYAHSGSQAMLKEAMSRVMKGDATPLADPGIAAAMPAALGRMIDSGGRDSASELLARMEKALYEGSPEVRRAVSESIENIVKSLTPSQILDILLKDFENKGGQKKAFHAGNLFALYTETIERLLDRLYESPEKSERNRIIQALTHIGRPAAELVEKRLSQDAPWYYTRNLALLLGRIGGQEHIDVLEVLIAYPDYRVQLEAVKSIQSISGEKAGAVLLKNIEEADRRLASYIISVIGALRYQEAVPYLIEVLESKRLRGGRREREEILAKSCEVLGRIQAAEAVSALEKIVRERGLIKGYSEKVRTAAAKALVNIKRG